MRPKFRSTTFPSWLGTAVLAGLGVFFFKAPANGAEPMMDTDLFKVSRLESYNLTKDGFFLEALKTEEKAFQIAQAQLGPLHPSLALILNDLGILYHTLAEYPKAEQTYKWGLALAEKNMGPDDPVAADLLDRLAFLYLDLNRLSEAELMGKKSLAIRQNHRSDDPLALIQTLGLLGRVEINLQNGGQAQPFLTQALKLLAQENPSDLGLSISFLNLQARAYELDKNPTLTQACLEKALALSQKSRPSDSAEVADAAEQLADFFNRQDQADKARPLYESAAQADRRFVGTNYSYASLPFLKRLAKADFSTGSLKDSEFLWKKSIQIEKDIFGPRHPKVALSLIALADVELALNKKSRSQEALKEALDILKSSFPADHPWLLLVQKRLN